MKRREFITLLGSAATGWPTSMLGAAQGKIPRVALLFFGYPDPSIFEKGFRDGLRNLGYEEGRSIELIVRSAGGRFTALASLAAELIGLQSISLSLIQRRLGSRSTNKQPKYLSSYTAETLRQPSW
jgi:putative tryptophan/tyrosine transport system substrate-binding protein